MMPFSSFKEKRFEANIDHLQSHLTAYLVMLAIIAGLELYMIVNAFCFYSLEKWYRTVQVICYVVLFTASVGTFAAVLYHRIKCKLQRLLVPLTQLYGSVILIWSTVISLTDLYNGNTIIVFLTVIIVVAVIMNMEPVLYTAIVVPCGCGLLIMGNLFQVVPELGATPTNLFESYGATFNYGVFILFSVLTVFVQSRLYVRNFISKRELEHLSYHDQLTGLLNRHTLQKQISELPPNTVFYFGIVDADNFKHVNDTYGHNMGDGCLQNIAKLLKQNFGERIFRYGGDEFVVIVEMREKDVLSHIDRINAELVKQYPNQGVHVSAGFYCPRSGNEMFKDYFKKADLALYQAKSNGKCQAAIYRENVEDE